MCGSETTTVGRIFALERHQVTGTSMQAMEQEEYQKKEEEKLEKSWLKHSSGNHHHHHHHHHEDNSKDQRDQGIGKEFRDIPRVVLEIWIRIDAAEIMRENERAKENARSALLKAAQEAANQALKRRRAGGEGGGERGEKIGEPDRSKARQGDERAEGGARGGGVDGHDDRGESGDAQSSAGGKGGRRGGGEGAHRGERDEEGKATGGGHDEEVGRDRGRGRGRGRRVEREEDAGKKITALERVKAKKLAIDVQRLLVDAAHAHPLQGAMSPRAQPCGYTRRTASLSPFSHPQHAQVCQSFSFLGSIRKSYPRMSRAFPASRREKGRNAFRFWEP
jgi:hypothetical protein